MAVFTIMYRTYEAIPSVIVKSVVFLHIATLFARRSMVRHVTTIPTS